MKVYISIRWLYCWRVISLCSKRWGNTVVCLCRYKRNNSYYSQDKSNKNPIAFFHSCSTEATAYLALHVRVAANPSFYLGSAAVAQGEEVVYGLVLAVKAGLVVVFLFVVPVPFAIPPVRKMFY